MSTSSIIKRISIVLIAVVIVLLCARWIYQTLERNRAYSFLGDAVATQPFADELGVPKRTETECYPPNKMKEYCPALGYELNSEICRQIIVTFTKNDDPDCKEYATFERKHNEKNVTYDLWVEDKILLVYVDTTSKFSPPKAGN